MDDELGVYVRSHATLAVLGLAAAGDLLSAIGVQNPSREATAAVSLGVIMFGSAANMIGGDLLKRLLYVTLTCELIASIGIGTALLFFHASNPDSTLFHGAGSGHAPPVVLGPFLGPVAFVGYSFVGFEAAGRGRSPRRCASPGARFQRR